MVGFYQEGPRIRFPGDPFVIVLFDSLDFLSSVLLLRVCRDISLPRRGILLPERGAHSEDHLLFSCE